MKLYNLLSSEEKLSLISLLHIDRQDEIKKSRVKKITKKKKKCRKPIFFNDKIEEMFNSMSQEQKDYIMQSS